MPIFRENLSAEDFMIPTSQKFAIAQSAESKLKQCYKWIDKTQCRSADAMAFLSRHM